MKGGYIFYTDKLLNITSWGRGISSFTGIKPSDAIGKKYYHVMERIKIGNSDALLKTIKDDRIIVLKDYPLQSAKGEVKADLTIEAIRDRKRAIRGVKVRVSHDPFHTHEEHLKSISGFFDTASHAHGLRGPLNTIKGASQFLRDYRSEDTNIKEFTDLIDEAANQMNEIIKRFLRLPIKRFELSDVDINRLLKKVKSITSYRTAMNNIKTSYSYGDVPSIQGDSLQIQHAIINVIDNAIEAMPEGGKLNITSGLEHFPEGDFLCITVSDTGHGTESFNKKDDRYKNGRGVGLTLTRLILHCHGGWMKISDNKEGTTVKMYLPLRREVEND